MYLVESRSDFHLLVSYSAFLETPSFLHSHRPDASAHRVQERVLAMAMELDDSSPLLLLCAHGGASHFWSLFHLAKRLLCHGFLITVVTPSPELHAGVSDQGRLRFESLTAQRGADILKSPQRILDLSRSFSDLVSRLGAKSGAIRCVVADYFAGYVYDAVDFFDLPLVLYFPALATSVAFNLQLPVLLARRNKIIRQAVEDPLTLKYRMASLARIPLTEDELDECLPKLNALGVALSREQLHHYMRDASVQLAAKKCERLFYARPAKQLTSTGATWIIP
ncbi:uncharacterized protein LOC112342878 [Selaginella moellendorffii]|uniref:uncharacterized protein LOC112342878 n=1 Tax=Selaginella moellendorffii TaxID=88036 RepID=UPI000D1CD833|nr:uncharacterized protein LOC112342878 [Selaginella moellendorffii]|eukprot:XP_024521219.1 uncharacterized protein LOC112342878 [Selaginella moellendorffii]